MQISYSTDGVRWVQIGTVGMDNWQNYKVAIPISSWNDLDNLQIMISTLPTVEQKPDIYLDGMYARVSYDRTLGEALSDTVAAAADAIDSVLAPAAATSAPAVAVAPPPPLVITTRSVSFASDGDPVFDGSYRENPSIAVSSAPGASSFVVSGSCSSKYFVILMYRNRSDYDKKPSSYIANEARECDNGSFSYDLADLPPSLQSGSYWLLTAEEGDTGGWTPVSRIFPVVVTATTTTEIVQQ